MAFSHEQLNWIATGLEESRFDEAKSHMRSSRRRQLTTVAIIIAIFIAVFSLSRIGPTKPQIRVVQIEVSTQGDELPNYKAYEVQDATQGVVTFVNIIGDRINVIDQIDLTRTMIVSTFEKPEFFIWLEADESNRAMELTDLLTQARLANADASSEIQQHLSKAGLDDAVIGRIETD